MNDAELDHERTVTETPKTYSDRNSVDDDIRKPVDRTPVNGDNRKPVDRKPVNVDNRYTAYRPSVNDGNRYPVDRSSVIDVNTAARTPVIGEYRYTPGHNDDVRASALSRTINRETLSSVDKLRLSVGPEIEQGKSPVHRSISTQGVAPDNARHIPMDNNRDTNGILECEECGMEFRQMWLLEFHQNRLCCGYVSQDDVANSVQKESLIRQATPVHMEAIRDKILDKGSKGDKKLRWIACSDGNVAKDAVKAGYDTVYKCTLYVCRAIVENEKVPGQVVPSHNCAFVTVNGKEVKVTEYDVLTDPQCRLSWKPSTVKGALPRGTQVGGYDANKLMYFIARGITPDRNHCSGKYVPQEQQCLFAWQGQEMSSEKFDFLCKKND